MKIKPLWKQVYHDDRVFVVEFTIENFFDEFVLFMLRKASKLLGGKYAK